MLENTDQFFGEIYQNLDVIWIIIALTALHEGQRIKAAVFCGACYIFLRLQIELLYSFGYPTGLFDILNTPLYPRGLLSYSTTTILFLVASIFSPATKGVMYLASALSAFVIAACISTIVLIL